MPAVLEGVAEPQDPDKPEELFLDEQMQISAMANQYNSDSLKSTQKAGLGTAKKVDTATFLSKLTPEQIKLLWKRRAEDQERRLPQRLAIQAEYKKQAAIGAEMIKEDRQSRFTFAVRPTPNILRLKFKVFGLYLAFQTTLVVLKVKRFFGKLFS